MGEAAFHPRLFKGSAKYYLKFRSVYPQRLIERVALLCGVTPQARILDLGCGPGILARAFAPLSREVVGVDPEPDMIEAARRYLADYREKAKFVCAGAHELPADLGVFSIVAIGRAFHWMDRQATLQMFDAMIEQTGAVVLFRDPAMKLPENAWRKAFDEVFARFASTEPARLGAQKVEQAIDEAYLLRSAFDKLERISTVETRSLTIDQLIGRAFSMAGTSPEDLKERQADFEAAMREALMPFVSDGKVTEITEPQALIARRDFGGFTWQ